MHGCEEKPFFTGKMVGSLFCVKNSNLESKYYARYFKILFLPNSVTSKNEKLKGHKWNTYSEFVTFIEVLLHFILYLFMVQWNCRYDGTIQRKSKIGKIWKKDLNICFNVILLQVIFSWEKGEQTKWTSLFVVEIMITCMVLFSGVPGIKKSVPGRLRVSQTRVRVGYGYYPTFWTQVSGTLG